MTEALIRGAAGDFLACLGFFTRIPVNRAPHAGRPFAQAQWAAPLAGAVVGLIGATVFWTATKAGLAPVSTALLVLAATLLATGCIHEDGLADVADGFGGGNTRERKLEIMRDSRIGTYGAAALFLSLGLRWAALGTLGSPATAAAALTAAHGASRGLLPAFLMLVPPARLDGLGAGVGSVPAWAAAVGLGLGALTLLPLGPLAAGMAAIALGIWFFGLKRLCVRQIGGQTGDVCGALQQGAEITVLLLASAALS